MLNAQSTLGFQHLDGIAHRVTIDAKSFCQNKIARQAPVLERTRIDITEDRRANHFPTLHC
ncbi:hypothetical protein X737_35785 [Mesorhizobium sp. L48C026A00]|nr:hypothetical protein X737_35785 [Mesorhizobium sp. L48C026A00]